MVTDKEAAAAYRILAQYSDEKHYGLSELYRRKADELDPPTPQWPDGLYCWRYDDAMVTYVRRFGGEWLDGYGMPDVQMIPPKGVTRVRVLGDDEIAVKRQQPFDENGPIQTRLYANDVRDKSAFICAASLVDAYADALDAEAIQAAEATNQQIEGEK